MKLKKKILMTPLLAVIAGIGLLAATPSYAWYPHHHYHPYHPHDYHHHSNGGALAAGLIFGAAVGMMAGASMSHGNYYREESYYNCRQVSYSRVCRYNGWEDRRCYRVRRVENVC